MTSHRRDEAARPHHIILSLQVTAGFFVKVLFEFADGLNCLIGPRGTGKTTVLELIRFCLGQEPSEKSLELFRAFTGVVKANLQEGRVRLRVRSKEGVVYIVERAWGEPQQVFDENHRPLPVTFDSGLLFRGDIYSQNEIEAIAVDTTRQLALLDTFVDQALLRRIDGDLTKVHHQLNVNASRLVSLDAQMADLEDKVGELPELEAKLKGYTGPAGADAKKLEAAHRNKALREKERKTLGALSGEVRDARDAVGSLAEGLGRKLANRVDRDLAEGENAAVFEPVAGRLASLAQTIEKAAREIDRECEKADSVLEKQTRLLGDRHASQDADYRAFLDKSNEEQGRAAERTGTLARFNEVTSQQRELGALSAERDARSKERKEWIRRFSELHTERFQARKAVTAELTRQIGGLVEVDIKQNGETDLYRELLVKGLQNAGIHHIKVAAQLQQEFTDPGELVRCLEKGDVEKLTDRTDLSPARAQKVIDALRGTERLYEIETVVREDRPVITLRDGASTREASASSTGQRCTAILPILLLASERPLLIDQPEDNLDGRFIAGTVVASIRAVKPARQMIFATHNANVVILSDSERIFVMDSDGKQGTVTRVGSVDEAKAECEGLLEGGKKAFMDRQKVYGR